VNSFNVNEASAIQLSVVLGLRPEEADKIIRSRPFTSVNEFRRVLPFRVARTQRDLEIQKLNINSATEDDLVKAGISPRVARIIRRRQPFYWMNEVRDLEEVDDTVFRLMDSLFAIPDIQYLNKLTTQTIKLVPDTSKLLVDFGDTESDTVTNVTQRLGLEKIFSSGQSGGVQVYSAPQTEEVSDVIFQLKQEPSVNKVLPAFRDQREVERFIDPQYCTVQFAPEISEDRQSGIISNLGLELEERHRSPGLVTLQIPGNKEDMNVLLHTIRVLNNMPEVKFAEPNFLGFDDME
jgi:hypothetical protein